MTNQIVTTNVTQTVAPAPSTLQRTGAIVTQGGTSTAANTLSLLTQASDLTPLLPAALALSSASWAGGTVTMATTNPHGFPSGQTISLTIAGMTPAAYNGTYDCTITSTTEFTYALASDPGSATVEGTVTPAAVAELANAVTTFFAQGSSVSVYVLEMGVGDAAHGVTALTSFLTANPGVIYSFLVPKSWDGEATFKTLMADYESTTAKTYFFTTTTVGTYSGYSSLLKGTYLFVESPDADPTEFGAAAHWWKTLSYNPSSANQVAPLAFSYIYSVTPYPTFGNSSTLAALKTSNVNYVGTGAEGGISTAIIFWGHLKDGNPWNYWYSVDWTQINVELALANEVINGSNNPAAPLYYDQAGINRLQARAVKTMQQAVSYGLALGNVIATQMTAAEFTAAYERGDFAGNIAVNAVPFQSYADLNPSDYAIGKYAGVSIVYAPARGFEQIIVNINATQVV